ALSQGVARGAETGTLRPHPVLDGFVHFIDPAVTVRPVEASEADTVRISSRSPPGLYGPEGSRRALNFGPEITTLNTLKNAGAGIFMSP
ncbi:MAG: hypothetical protein O7A62_14940, partial [Alphaproteobacteria bacterium]|nr:hypothetical protein [Alphaproteobacteria bacterium]